MSNTEIQEEKGVSVQHIPAAASSPTHSRDGPHSAAQLAEPEKAERPSLSTILAVMFLGLSFVGPISVGFAMVTSVIVQIETALGDPSGTSWIVGGWSVASSVSFSIAGSFSDIFGRRYIIIIGNIAALVGAIIGATAHSINAIIAGMTLIGFGCGLIFVAFAGISELLPNKYRGMGLGFAEACIGVPWNALAVLLGNELYTHASWRWIFYIAVIYSGICVIGLAVFYFPPSRPQEDYEKSRWQEIKEIDYVGVTLYTGGLTTFLIGLTWAGSTGHAWTSASVIAPLVIGGVVFIACFVYDFTVPKNPLFPYYIFRQWREFTVLLIFVFVSGMSFYAMSALLPQASLFMFTHDSTQIGILSIPGGIGQVLGGALLPALVHRIKHVKIQIICALVIQTVFVGCYSVVIPSNRNGWMALQFFAQGCFPLIALLCYLTAGLHVQQKDLGVASGLIGTFRSAGGSLGNAIFNTILDTIVNKQLPLRISAAAVSLGYPAEDLGALIPAVIEAGYGVPGTFANVPNITAAIETATATAFKESYAYAFRRVFWSSIPFGVIAIIAACFMTDPSKHLTNHVAVHMEKEVLGQKKHEEGTKSQDMEAI